MDAQSLSQVAEDAAESGISIKVDGEDGGLVPALKIAALLLLLSLIPALLVSVTSFARIVIVLGFLRQGLGTQTLPPTQVIVGLSIFLCLFTMSPVLSEVNEVAVQPYRDGEMNEAEALEAGLEPIREFMGAHTRPEDLTLFVSMTQDSRPNSFQDVGTAVLVPAFMLSELKTAFTMGAMILIPFLIIDLVVASVLMAMGMMMVPPVMVSLPIKIILFVLADGWNLVVESLARSIMGA
ncbi:MAG: flagellar type III secretion system pore protein FliP [Myxococcales bacterium]|nr:flagellar type III secretion system pore protein FliP [Myxococcales bacterium]